MITEQTVAKIGLLMKKSEIEKIIVLPFLRRSANSSAIAKCQR
jgi:hypothetical protein